MGPVGDPRLDRLDHLGSYRYERTEVISQGMEYFYRDPVAFAEADPEWARFILAVLDGSFKP